MNDGRQFTHSGPAGKGTRPARRLLTILGLSVILVSCGHSGDPLQVIDATRSPGSTAGSSPADPDRTLNITLPGSRTPGSPGAGNPGGSGTGGDSGSAGAGEPDSESGSAGSSSGSGGSGGSSATTAKRPDPKPKPASTENKPKPQKPARPKPPTEPTRPGAPYDIEPFDNIGGPLSNFRDAVTSRCGGAGSSCLTVVEVNNGDSDPADCIVRSISYRPEPGPADAPDGEKKLQRGTTVTVTSDCTSPEEETSGSDD